MRSEIHGEQEERYGIILRRMTSRRFKITYLILVLILLAGAALFYFYFLKDRSNPKEFRIEDQTYILSPGEVKILPGSYDYENGDLDPTEAILSGYIDDDPIVNSETGETELEVNFKNKEGNEILVRVILGDDTNKILVTLASDGVVPIAREDKEMSVSEIRPLLKRGDPIIIRIYLDRVPDSLINSEGCSQLCLESLAPIRESFEVNNSLVQSIKTSQKPESTGGLQARGVSGLVIFIES